MRLLKEPLLHFFVLGALTLAAVRYVDGGTSGRYRIDAGPAQRARLEATYREQYGVAPTSQQLQYLLDQWVRSEILFREGLALGLERDDEIVRRRVVQKIEFVNQDVEADATPDETQLAAYFEQHKSRYVEAPRVSFTQLYFSMDHGSIDPSSIAHGSIDLDTTGTGNGSRDPGAAALASRGGDGSAAAKARAERALQAIKVSSAAEASGGADLFAEGTDFTALDHDRAARLFGDSPFSKALLTAPVGAWSGPYESGYGWHVLRVTAREAARTPELRAVRARVEADYRAEWRDRRNAEAYRALAAKYHIVTDGAAT